MAERLAKQGYETFALFMLGRDHQPIVKPPIQYKDMYQRAVDKDGEKSMKQIDAEQIKANILIIVGEGDQMWNRLEMANLIKSQNKQAAIVSYQEAGHVFGGNGILSKPNRRIRLGGSFDRNQRAATQSDQVIDDFLNQVHH